MDLRKSKYILPNLFTLASVFFGLFAIASVMEGGGSTGVRRAAIAILVALIADGLDGRVARMTRSETKFGVQLDPLADVISFWGGARVFWATFALSHMEVSWVGLLIAFIYVACGRCDWLVSMLWLKGAVNLPHGLLFAYSSCRRYRRDSGLGYVGSWGFRAFKNHPIYGDNDCIGLADGQQR